MRVVIDTSILISSLIKDSVTREILLLPFMKFYLPDMHGKISTGSDPRIPKEQVKQTLPS
jgi:hypothetical protein